MNEKKYTISEIAISLQTKRCIECKEDIDKSFNNSYKWTLPLCRKCRIKAIN